MKDKILFTLVCLTAAGALTGCGAKQVLQSYRNTISVETQPQDTMLEGVIVVNLPTGEKLENATWEDGWVWYLTRPMREDEIPEEWTLQKQTNYGIYDEKVIFKESK